MIPTDSEQQLKALMVASLEGDRHSYRALLGDLETRLSRFVGGRTKQVSDKEDLVQDILLAIHARRETYDSTLPFLPWVYAIARYKLIDHYRVQGRRLFLSLEEVGELIAPDQSRPMEVRHDIEWALSRLSESARKLVRSLKIEGLSVAETARQTARSEGAIKVAMHRSLKALAEMRGPLSGEIGEDRHG